MAVLAAVAIAAAYNGLAGCQPWARARLSQSDASGRAVVAAASRGLASSLSHQRRSRLLILPSIPLMSLLCLNP